MLQLRGYQQRSLDALEAYLRLVVQHGAKQAFILQTNRPYHSPPQLPGLPYVCLRVPTGGGKTLMACHAVGIAARHYLQSDRPVCLWLVPSNTIREQTLAALRNRQHPYRQAIDAQFSGQVQVTDLSEALYVQRSVLEGATCLIVSTLAALRVEETEGRKVYEESGALQHHFTVLAPSLVAGLERREDGSIICSLANVLRLWRPLVMVDEAHNARTPLSFDTLARFHPSCIIEFTATPETRHNPDQHLFASNVLHHVSAAELKAEDMVKLPIKLETRSDWKEVVGDAVQTRRMLEEAANEEERQTGEHLRPLILFQAQPKSSERQTLTTEVIKTCLIEDFRIPEDQIAIATGQTREIDETDLFDRACPIRYVITVYALKEGWDCSFAYVLCSVAEISSPRAVEQILGRILRLPYAKRKQRSALNCAYAFAASSQFIEAANSLKDALIEHGFQRFEAETMVVPNEQYGSLFEPGMLFAQASERLSQPPDLSALEPALRQRLAYDPASQCLIITSPLSEQEKEALQHCVATVEDRAAVERLYHATRGQANVSKTTAQSREPFQVPALAVRVDGQLELFDDSCFLDEPWNLALCDASLSEAEFPSQVAGGVTGEVDVNQEGRVEYRFVQQVQEQFLLLMAESGWTTASLANWLDRQIPHSDIPQAQSSLFIHKAMTKLIESRSVSLEHLARQKFRLRDALEGKINQHRHTQRAKGYQQWLFGSHRQRLEVNPELCFSFSEEQYAPNWPYEGGYQFQKHYFRVVGELESEGEEFECAAFLDHLPQVKYWVRNLSQRDTSFWLQTSTDHFYPDFVALLGDGQILIVEAKGEHLWSNDDSKEKRAVGELWEECSRGTCLFVMPKGKHFEEITAKIRSERSVKV